MTGMTRHPLRLSIIALLVVAAAIIASGAWLATRKGDRLVPDPPRHPTVFEKAAAARLAIRRGDFAKAQRIIGDELRTSRVRRWHFAPFAGFINSVAAPSDDSYARQLDNWVVEAPGLATPWLVRGLYEHNMAWWVRGNGFVADVRPANGNAFQRDAAAAADDLRRAADIDPKNPGTRFFELLAARDNGGDATQEEMFESAIKVFPDYYALYSTRLSELQPKWGGSIQAMQQFVQRYAGAVAPDSPLKMLNLQLYQQILDAVSIQCSGEDEEPCIDTEMSHAVTPEVANAAEATLSRFARVGDVDAVDEIGGILRDMLSDCGCQRFSLAMLTSAADALGSNTQLVVTGTGKNNYMIDQLVSYFWRRQGNDANAETFDKRALIDLRNTRFATVNDADRARAGIYDDLAAIANTRRDYPTVLAYEDASAKLLGGYGSKPGYNRLACEALFRLKRYDEALRTCTAIIHASRDLQAEFFRAHVYEALGKTGDAIRGYGIVADSYGNAAFSDYAAIEISVIYDRAHDYRKALGVLDHYRGLLTEGAQSRYDLASYYNDLCYDKMQLGDFNGALQDCTTSIAYKPIPDAMKKQQELVRRLAASSSTSTQTGI